MHLVIDGYRGDSGRMWDAELIRQFLYDLPDAMGMTRITEPSVLEYNAPKAEDSGISGFVIIAESHISVHTFPRRDHVNVDIFSCRPFDSDMALSRVKELFSLEEVETWQLERGLEWLDTRQGKTETQRQRTQLEARGSATGSSNPGV
ncbi:MAG: S-adenosylmethionine decarboxylase [Chloroflexi bacterium]|nr:S-adenosylmethionine decarboxylase [Chloroflexota bacterium]